MAAHLEAQGHPDAEPLRWAITGIDPQRGLRLEGIGLQRTTSAAVITVGSATSTAPPGPQAAANTSTGEAH